MRRTRSWNLGTHPRCVSAFGYPLIAVLISLSGAGPQARSQDGQTAADHAATHERPAGALVDAVRQSTAPFHDFREAERAGYTLMFGCVSGPDWGAMGLHFVNPSLIGDDWLQGLPGKTSGARLPHIMKQISRREFVAASGMIGTSLALDVGLSAGQSPVGRGQSAALQTPEMPAAPLTFKTRPRKALIARPTEDELKQMKAAGFEGVEARVLPPDEAAKMRKVAEALGMRVHSVLYGWAEFNNPDKSEVDRTFAEAQGALRSAEAFGADAVLLVPCRIGPRGGRGAAAPSPAEDIRMPRPWEFQIEFDDRTGHLRRVVYGDNAPYADYIKAHNHATDASTEWVKRLIPLAEKTKVVIALENVSNNLWVKPAIFRHFVQSFQSPWVKAYYDIGNHVRFAPPEDWILTLGDLLAKIHVKDYLLDPADPRGFGTSVNIREGSVRWPVLRQALEVVNYNGWMTIESNGSISFEERNRRLDLILSGK